MTDDQTETEFAADYDAVEQGHVERITKPGHWTIWRNSEGFVSVRRYDNGEQNDDAA